MDKIKIYDSINEDIRKAMYKEGIENSCMPQFIKFISQKEEKYTYDIESEKYFVNSFFPSFPSQAWDRFENGIRKIARGERVPLQVDVAVTGRCHCDCWHCFRAKYADNSELPLEKIKELFNSFEELGTNVVGITGGEPMLRKDIIDILQLIPDNMEGQLYTTGVNIDRPFAKALSRTNVKRVLISLDHYKEELVCKLRSNKNAYKDAINAVNCLKEYPIYVAITVCISDEMLVEGELERYIEFAKELEVNEIRMVSTIPQGKLEGSNEALKHSRAMALITKMKHKYANDLSYPAIVNFGEIENVRYLGCGAGVSYSSVNSDGAVTPCVAVPLSYGNIYDKSFNEIYQEMGKYFVTTSCSCQGVASNIVRRKIGITIDRPPLDKEKSIEIIKQCRSSMQPTAFIKALQE